MGEGHIASTNLKKGVTAFLSSMCLRQCKNLADQCACSTLDKTLYAPEATRLIKSLCGAFPS